MPREYMESIGCSDCGDCVPLEEATAEVEKWKRVAVVMAEYLGDRGGRGEVKIKCDVCSVDICLPGALVFGPPEQAKHETLCLKWHLCRDCFNAFRTAFAAIATGSKRRAAGDSAP